MSEGRFSKLERKDSKEKQAKGFPPPAGTVARGEDRPAQTPDTEDPNLYPSFIQQADEAFFTGNFRDALRHYSRALQQENNHVYPWIGQISSLIELKQYKEAELWSNRALEQFPEDSSLLSQRARVLALTGNIKRALGVSDYAMSKGATEWTWLARGEVLLESKDRSALFCFEKAVEEAGDADWRVPFLAGLAFSRKRQWANAQDFLRRAAEIHPKNYFVWFEMARVLMGMSYIDRAQDALNRVLQLKPDYKPAREMEVALYRRPFFKRVFGLFKR